MEAQKPTEFTHDGTLYRESGDSPNINCTNAKGQRCDFYTFQKCKAPKEPKCWKNGRYFIYKRVTK